MADLLVEIGDKEFEADFLKNDISSITINGKPYKFEVLKRISENILSLSVNNKVYQIEYDLSQNGKSKIYLDGLSFDVGFTDDTRKLLKKFIQQAKAAAGAGAQVKAPMPGMVVKILVEEGQEVEAGQSIVIIEAMKMENALKAPVTGKVTKIACEENKAVEKDALLLEIGS